MATQDIVLYFTLASTALNLLLDVFHNVRSGHFQSTCCGRNLFSFAGDVEKKETEDDIVIKK